MMLDPRIKARNENRPGSALVLVLVVIAMLSLGAYTFSELMITEYRAVEAYGRQTQSAAWAQSGVEYVAALLAPDGGGWETDLYHNAALFHLPVSEDGGFTVVAPVEDSVASGQSRQQGAMVLRMGLMDESARINLNALALLDPEDGVAFNMMMAVPGMTEELADCILDWIDADDEPREYGKEINDYSGITPRNGPIQSLEELLQIEGVTPWHLYGEDSNRNGLLDPNENDQGASMPWDNGDDVLDFGWSEYFTVSSKETNLRHDFDQFGQARVNVNQQLLTDLYDELEEKFDSDVARFVTAYRLNGPLSASGGISSSSTGSSGTSGSGSGSGSGGASGGSGAGGGSSGGGNSGNTGSGNPGGGASSGGPGGGSSGGGSSSGSGGGGSGGSGSSGAGGSSSSGANTGGGGSSAGAGGGTGGGSGRGGGSPLTGLWRPSLTSGSSSSTATTGDAATDSALQNAAGQLADVLGGGSGAVTRGGIDLTNGGGTEIRSIYELVGAQVQVVIDGSETILDSPWPSDPGSLQRSLPELLDQLTITDETAITGRININEARLSVLAAIPGMPEGVPEQIIATRAQRLSGSGASAERFSTAGWLLIEGLVDLPTMVELDSSITTRGEVMRVQVVGHADRGGPMTRIEAVIDASTNAPKVIQQRNLSRLGPGFQPGDLPTFGQPNP